MVNTTYVGKGKSTNPNLKVGICGEHGGEPTSVGFCHEVGMNYGGQQAVHGDTCSTHGNRISWGILRYVCPSVLVK